MIQKNILLESSMEAMNNEIMAMLREWIVQTGRDALRTEYSDKLAYQLGWLEEEMGNLETAKQLYQRALTGQEKNLGKDHSSTLTTVNNLALLEKKMGNLETAKQLYQRALTGREKNLGKDHSSTLDTAYGLATVEYKLGEQATAVARMTGAKKGFAKKGMDDRVELCDAWLKHWQ